MLMTVVLCIKIFLGCYSMTNDANLG